MIQFADVIQRVLMLTAAITIAEVKISTDKGFTSECLEEWSKSQRSGELVGRSLGSIGGPFSIETDNVDVTKPDGNEWKLAD